MNELENYDVCASAYDTLWKGEFSLGVFPGLLKKIIENKMWERRRLPNGKLVELRSLRELITKRPLEGWGEDPKRVEHLIRDDLEILTMFRDKMKAVNQYDLPNNNVMGQKVQGNSRSYTLSRLFRETPELYEQVCLGKLSANAAAIKAGFRKKPSPYEQAVKLLSKLTPDEKQQLRDLLNEDLGGMVRAKTTGK